MFRERQREAERTARARTHLRDGLKVAVGRDREACLTDVDAEARELLGDVNLLACGQRRARGLLAVPQGRVCSRRGTG